MIKARYQKMYTEKYKQDMDFVIIGDHYIGPFVDMDVAQKAVSSINKQFAPQPKRTRTEYEKVTDSIFDLRNEFERGELYFQQGGEYLPYKLEAEFAHGFMHDRIYRKVEKEIDERQEFIDNAYYLAQSCGSHDVEEVAGVMYDAGCRFQD